MGEIKSTLDLVFEKTRNLTLSDEEKLSLAREKLDKKVQGLCNRYLDNFFTVSRLKDEMEKIASNDRELAYNFLKKYLLAHFDLDSNNSLIVSAFSEIAGFDIAPLTILQREYQAEKEDNKRAFNEKTLLALEERGVLGSAVVPNLNHIPEWDQFLNGLHRRYQERLKTIENN